MILIWSYMAIAIIPTQQRSTFFKATTMALAVS